MRPVDGCQDGTPFVGALFQFLAAGVYVDQEMTRTLFLPYEIKTLGQANAKIGIIALPTDTTPTTSRRRASRG
jgi:5'-nucleotidase